MRYQLSPPCLLLRLDPPHPYKKRKKNPSRDAVDEMMSLFQPTSQHLKPPSAPSQKHSQHFVQRDVDEFLSSDLEVSFASTVSLNSPPKDNVPLTPDRDHAEPMDISPLPPPKSHVNVEGRRSASRPRAYTSNARLFGNDLSNNAPTLPPSPQVVVVPSCDSNASDPSTKSGGTRTQRSALPTEWLMTASNPDNNLEVHIVSLPIYFNHLIRMLCSQL